MSTDTLAAPANGDVHLAKVRIAKLPGVDIAYETFGDPKDPAMLLVMGLGTQMLGYHEKMCQMLADEGHFVVRYDNRDIGLSTHWSGGVPSLPSMLLRRNPPYRIADMAADGFGLADHLGLDRFHLVGTSMGGFISQRMAIDRPERIRSLTLVMTSTGSRRVGRPTPAVMLRMARQSPAVGRAAAIEANVETYSVIGSPDVDFDEIREVAGWSYDRSDDTSGRDRQLAAILAQPDRTPELRHLDVPTLVVHGLDDPLVAPSGGLALAEAIPAATFLGYHGKGHDLTRSTWQRLSEDILTLASRAQDRADGRLSGSATPAGGRNR